MIINEAMLNILNKFYNLNFTRINLNSQGV